jgi:hypothetical protein
MGKRKKALVGLAMGALLLLTGFVKTENPATMAETISRTDWTCYQHCLKRGYSHGYCKSACSW